MEQIVRNEIIILIPVLTLLFLLSACIKDKEENRKTSIKYLQAFELPIPEPSGLSLTFEQNGFWIVSDENSTVYKLNEDGKIIKEFKVDGFDLEGITVLDSKVIAVVLERAREVVILDTAGNELKRTHLDFQGEENSGLEGISYNADSKKYYIVNEKKPSLLIQLDDSLIVLSVDTLKISKDISGIYYDSNSNFLWMLSDESQLIVRTDLDGNLLEKIDITIVQPEGIVLDNEGKRLYIVSDKREKIYVFEKD
jgi:uncharacterized protein YjiK